jgi:hypothetical protein
MTWVAIPVRSGSIFRIIGAPFFATYMEDITSHGCIKYRNPFFKPKLKITRRHTTHVDFVFSDLFRFGLFGLSPLKPLQQAILG